MILDMDGLELGRGGKTVRVGEAHGVGAWLPESVAIWAAGQDVPITVDLSGLPAEERREYARSFAEAWADAGEPARLLVAEGELERPRSRVLPWVLGASAVAALALPPAALVLVAGVAGGVLGLRLAMSR